MKGIRFAGLIVLLFTLALTPLSAGKGGGKPGGGGGGGGVALETTHFATDSGDNPVDIQWSDADLISEANDGHEITFDKNGTYKMTMQCSNPGDCPRSFSIHLSLFSGDCPDVNWETARMSIRVDNVESVDGATVPRSGWAQIRELVGGEAVGALYTLNWDGQDEADLIDVTGNGGSSWDVEAVAGSVANMRVPAPKGNKTIVCGQVYASFSFHTEIMN